MAPIGYSKRRGTLGDVLALGKRRNVSGKPGRSVEWVILNHPWHDAAMPRSRG